MPPKKIGLIVASVAVLAAGAVGGASLAGAATKGSSDQAYGEGPRGWGGGQAPGGEGGPSAGSQDAAVTGSEKTKVTDAVKAKDSSVTVQGVRKDPDGSYDVFGTKGGAPVMLEVSKDLKTITENTGGHGGPGGAPQPESSS